MIPKESGSDPKALLMSSLSDSGDESNVLYEIVTGSAVVLREISLPRALERSETYE